jgi:hypothetical protein
MSYAAPLAERKRSLLDEFDVPYFKTMKKG